LVPEYVTDVVSGSAASIDAAFCLLDMPDRRSPEARLYRTWYKTARWRAIRAHQLAAEPLCRYCMRRGVITPATVCDHVQPHRGNAVLFHDGPFQSLCAPCHDRSKRLEEERGFSTEIGLDGYPVDPRHPASR